MLQTYKTVVYMWLTRLSNKPIAIKLIDQYACARMSTFLLGCDAVSLGKKFPEQYRKNSSLTAWLWKWRQYNPSKHQEVLRQQHIITSQKIWLLST